MKRYRSMIVIAGFGMALSPLLAGCDSSGEDTEAMLDLKVSGSGFDPHNGMTLHLAVVDSADNNKVVGHKEVVVKDGEFSFSWSNLLEKGYEYDIDYYADMDGDGACDASMDHVWRMPIAKVTDDIDLQLTHNTNFTSEACASFKSSDGDRYELKFEGSEFSPHEGQMIHVVVIELGENKVVHHDEAAVTNGEFAISWPNGLEKDYEYDINYYADMNEDDECDPNDDHVWRVPTGKVTGDVDIQVTHNTDFTPEACVVFDGL